MNQNYEVFKSWIDHRPEFDHLSRIVSSKAGRVAFNALQEEHEGGEKLVALGWTSTPDGWLREFWKPSGDLVGLLIQSDGGSWGVWHTGVSSTAIEFRRPLDHILGVAAAFVAKHRWASSEAPVSAGIRFVKGGKVLMVHPSGSPKRGTYGIPKGLVEPGESWDDRAEQEVFEETGIDARSWIPRKDRNHPDLIECRDENGKLLKTVAYWTMKGDDLPDVVPYGDLQHDEVDWAGFVGPDEIELVVPYQRSLVAPAASMNRVQAQTPLDMALRGPLAVDLPGFKRGEMGLPRNPGVRDTRLATQQLLEERFGVQALEPYVAEYRKLMTAFDPRWLEKQRREMEEGNQPFTDAEWAEQVAQFRSDQEGTAYPFIAALLRKDPPTILAVFDQKNNPKWYSVARRWFGDHADAILAEARRAEQEFWAKETKLRAEAKTARETTGTLNRYRFLVEDQEVDGTKFVAFLRANPVAIVKHTSPKIDYYVYVAGMGLWELDKTFGAALRAVAPDLTDTAARTKTNVRWVERPTGLGTTLGIHSWPTRYQWFDNKLDAHWATDGTGRVFMLGGLDAADRRRIERSGVNLATDAIKVVEIESAPAAAVPMPKKPPSNTLSKLGFDSFPSEEVDEDGEADAREDDVLTEKLARSFDHGDKRKFGSREYKFLLRATVTRLPHPDGTSMVWSRPAGFEPKLRYNGEMRSLAAVLFLSPDEIEVWLAAADGHPDAQANMRLWAGRVNARGEVTRTLAEDSRVERMSGPTPKKEDGLTARGLQTSLEYSGPAEKVWVVVDPYQDEIAQGRIILRRKSNTYIAQSYVDGDEDQRRHIGSLTANDEREGLKRALMFFAPVLRFYRFRGTSGWLADEPPNSDNRWLAEYTFADHGKEARRYLLPADPEDGWASVGRHELASDYTLIDTQEVPVHVRRQAMARLAEAPGYLQAEAVEPVGEVTRTLAEDSRVERMAKKKWMFHASPVENRLSIREDGLQPGYDASYGPPAVYLFRDELLAENYRGGEPFDVWAVNVAGVKIHKDPEDPVGAVYVDEDYEIGPDQVEFRGTFLDGVPVEVSDGVASSDASPSGSGWADYFTDQKNGRLVGPYRIENIAWRPAVRGSVVIPLTDLREQGVEHFLDRMAETQDETAEALLYWYGTKTRRSDLGAENQGLVGVPLSEIMAAGFTHLHGLPLDTSWD